QSLRGFRSSEQLTDSLIGFDRALRELKNRPMFIQHAQLGFIDDRSAPTFSRMNQLHQSHENRPERMPERQHLVKRSISPILPIPRAAVSAARSRRRFARADRLTTPRAEPNPAGPQ